MPEDATENTPQTSFQKHVKHENHPTTGNIQESVEYKQENKNGLLASRKLIECLGIGLALVVIIKIITGVSGNDSNPKTDVYDNIYPDTFSNITDISYLIQSSSNEDANIDIEETHKNLMSI